MDKFKSDWDTYHLAVDANGIDLNLHWSNVEELSYYSTLQSGQFGRPERKFSKQTFFEEFPVFYNKMWKLNHHLGVYDIPADAKVLDIGSGVAVIDLLLAAQFPNSKIYLLDKEEMNLEKDVYYSDNYFFYHSWKPVIDCINTTKLKVDSINILNISDNWPDNLDMITSYFSWCMHYPKETYWSKVIDHLSPTGKLVVDVRNLNDRDTVNEITEELKVYPKKFALKNTVPKWIDDYGTDILGWRCVWQRGES